MFFDEFVEHKIHKIGSYFCFVDGNNQMRKFEYSRRGLVMCRRAIINDQSR